MDANALKDWKERRRLNWRKEAAIQDARERRRLHGRTWQEARELYCEAAKSAAICGECFRPLAPTDSVTMGYRKVGGSRQKGNEHYVRVPICLLCTIDNIPRRGFLRTRCLNCGRPLRLYRPHWRPGWRSDLDAPLCCADCRRLARNEKNKLRRRVEHEAMICIACGESFVPKRADAVTCSNRCRQAQYRRRNA
jgi:hypothetical protein